MSDKRTILIQLDTDALPSVFDRVVAVDAGAQDVFSYGSVTPENVQPLVHGAIFTRGPKDLKHTAIFVGGSDVAAGEKLLTAVRNHLLPQYGLQVSVMLDSNGANTTAAAAVRTAAKHMDLAGAAALVLGGTGPVGQRVALLLAKQGADVRVASRQVEKATAVCERIRAQAGGANVEPVGTAGDGLRQALQGRNLLISAGASGAALVPENEAKALQGLKVIIDLNAVPPAGVAGVEPTDKAVEHYEATSYGALAVGGVKMRIHKAAVAALFSANDRVFDAESIYQLAAGLP